MKKIVILSLLIFAAASFGGCKVLSKGASKALSKANQESGDTGSSYEGDSAYDTAIDVMNEYTRASNTLQVGNKTNRDLLEEYKKQKLAELTKAPKKLENPFHFSSVSDALKNLEKGREKTLGAPYDKVEAAADELIAALKTFVPTLEAYDKYVRSKEYVDDKGEFAKKQDADFIKQAEDFVDKYEKFEAAFDEASIQHDKRYVEMLRAAGETRQAYCYEGAGLFKDILRLFNSEADLKDADKQAKSEALAQSIKELIEKLDAENKKDTADEGFSAIENMVKKMNDLLGHYRTFKSNGYKAKDFDKFIEEYNRFIQFELNFLNMSMR